MFLTLPLTRNCLSQWIIDCQRILLISVSTLLFPLRFPQIADRCLPLIQCIFINHSFFLIVSGTSAIKCYECNSVTGGNSCGDPFKSGTEEDNCKQCGKIKYKAGGVSGIFKYHKVIFCSGQHLHCSSAIVQMQTFGTVFLVPTNNLRWSLQQKRLMFGTKCSLSIRRNYACSKGSVSQNERFLDKAL